MTNLQTLKTLFASAERWPESFKALQAVAFVQGGMPLKEAAKKAGTTAKTVQPLLDAPDVMAAFFKGVEASPEEVQKAKVILGGLIVGLCAELAFEEIYKREMHTQEFELRDARAGRTNTDYRMHNGQGRPVYRINIKFHGSHFRRADELVGLKSEDCFALATYKIHSALKKQEEEALPYLFVIVSAGGRRAEDIGEQIPEDLLKLPVLLRRAGMSGIRTVEEMIVEYLRVTGHPVFQTTQDEIGKADWYILSARRAYRLLRDLLFERVYALRTRNFAQAFRGAELDMHFSLSQDLIPLHTYLHTLREHGYIKVTGLLERGDF